MRDHWFCLLVLVLGCGPLLTILAVGPHRFAEWLERRDR